MSKFAAVLALVAFSGCSIALQKKPARSSDGKVTANGCTESKALPIVDLALTAAAIATSVYGFTRVDKTGDAIGGSVGFSSILFLASGKNGLDDANACRALHTTQPVASR